MTTLTQTLTFDEIHCFLKGNWIAEGNALPKYKLHIQYRPIH